jgi:hypothetical protein
VVHLGDLAFLVNLVLKVRRVIKAIMDYLVYKDKKEEK